MTNRKLAYILQDQKPVVLVVQDTVQDACRYMWERRRGEAGHLFTS